MTRVDLSNPKKLELRLSPLLNDWTEASQPRLQFYSLTVEKTRNATVQFSSSRSLSHGIVKRRYIFFFSDRRVVRVVLISLLSYWRFCNRRPCLMVSSRGELRIWKGWGCRSSEILNYTPKGDRSGRGPRFFWPLKETMLQHRQYIYIFIFFGVQP